MKKLWILPILLLFVGCPDRLFPDGGGTIKDFDVKETESSYLFSWKAVDLTAFKEQNPREKIDNEEELEYEMTCIKQKNGQYLANDFKYWSTNETTLTVKKSELKPGRHRIIVRRTLGKKVQWQYLSRQLEIDVNPSGKVQTYPIADFGYETTANRLLFLWSAVDFTEYAKVAAADNAEKAKKELFYTVKIVDSTGKTVIEKACGTNTELSLAKAELPSDAFTAVVVYEYLASGDPKDPNNAAFQASMTATP